MTLSEELAWRGFVNQTTFKDITAIDGAPITFYWGVDPSADSMQVGNFAAAMMVKHFIRHGHKAVLLVGGATGMIGDPDGKADERNLKSFDEITTNKNAIANQYRQIFQGMDFEIVDNYDWFRDMNYLAFLRDVGKHVPMRQMLQRDFIQTRLGDEGSGISYAEFSYVLIQGYDFLHLYRHHGVTLQVAASDQWGNSIAGVELIRRIDGGEAHVWTTPLIINRATGKKFGKSEEGAVWLDPDKTTPTAFYQFWMNVDDEGVEDYLKIYTELEKDEIERIMEAQRANPAGRQAQQHLAREVTRLVHGEENMHFAEVVTDYLVGKLPVTAASDEVLAAIRNEIPAVTAPADGAIDEVLVATGLANSLTEARRLLADNGVAINGQKPGRDHFEPEDFENGRLMLRKGKKYKDSALVELQSS